MKRLITVTLLTSFVQPQAHSGEQELAGPTNQELMAVSFNFMEESMKVMKASSQQKKDCDENKEIKPAAPVKPVEEAVCFCDLPGDKKNSDQLKMKESLMSKIIGDVESTEIELITGNDNFMHGVLQLSKDAANFDGDDRGRTFNMGGGIKWKGSEGSLSLKLDSTGFGKFDRTNGLSKDSTGKYFLNYHEMNTMDLRFDKYIDKSEAGKTYLIGEVGLMHRTDEGGVSRKFQEWWHDFNSETVGLNMIRYHYTKEEEAKTSVRTMVGLGKEWIGNLANWRCVTKAEAMIGLTGTKNSAHPELAVRTEAKVSHSSVKWIALSTWAQAKSGYMGASYEGGINLSMPFKKRSYTVEPFIGIERHKTSLDKKYRGTSGNAYENYHVFGVTIKY